jgi:hypothetical protein
VKKVLPLIIGLMLLICLPLSVVFGVTEGQDYDFKKDITISHGVEKIDTFTVVPTQIHEFANTGERDFAACTLANNTRDGYRVTLQAFYGQLTSATSSDGEVPIDYRLGVRSSGVTPGTEENSFQILTVPTVPPTSETLILGCPTGNLAVESLLIDPTDLTFTLFVKLTTDDFLTMAGTYSDTITIKYTDL